MKAVVKCLGVCVIGLAGLTMLRAAQQPKVPEHVRELLQDRKFDEAADEIAKLLAAKDDKRQNPDYLLYLQGRTLHLAGKHREALQAFALIERDHAASPWVRRAKFGQAAALLKLGDFEAAEHIYEEEVSFLLSTERKHEIASIYLEFADAYFLPPKKPGDGGTVMENKPDYQKALNFYKQALAVGPNEERRLEVEFRVARCHQELGQHAEAAAAYQAFLKAHPKSKFDVDARYQLGAAQLAQGQNVEARKSWKDLLDANADRKIELLKELSDKYPNEQTQRLAEAAYGISRTYGLPQPPSKEDMELGVAAAERFIVSFPDIKLAAQSALDIAQAYVAHNRQDEAIARLKKLLADKKYVGADVIPDARVLLGFAYQRQKKFPEAIAAWQEYLAKHAAHQSWAQVQQAIIDTEFLTALEARREGSRQLAVGSRQKKFEEARKLWEAFLARYPLDGRAAAIMLEFGLMNFEQGDAVGQAARLPVDEKVKAGEEEKKASEPAGGPPALRSYESAIADWTSLVSKYPNTEEASRGQYLIGLTYEEKLGKFDEALAAYRKLTWGQFAPRAAERISRLTRQELAIETERVFRTNQQPRIKVTTRNIKQLTVKAYRVDLETYFRKMHLARGIEALDIALIDPEKTWTFEVQDYADHKQLTSHIDIPLDSPGVMAVTVANEPKPTESAPAGITVRPQEATTMVMQSDLDILVKCSRNELFVFAENMRTGKPFSGVKLLVSDGNKVFAEGTTNDDGVFVGAVSDQDKTWEPLKASNDIRVFAVTERREQKPLRASANSAVKDNPARRTAEDAKDRGDNAQIGQDDRESGPALRVGMAHFASNVVGLQGVEFAQGIAAKGYIYTERPTYRAGQLVHVRGVVRWVKGDEYFFEAGKKFKLDVYDSRGRQIRSEEVALGEFGSFATRFVLPSESPQGDYRLHVHDPAEPDRHNYQGAFAVHEYQLQPVTIEIDTPQKVYYRGDQIAGTIKLRYYYGSPVADREIRFTLPDGTIHTEKTSSAGEVPFKFDTREFREDQTLQIVVQYPEINLAAGLNLFLSTHGFRATVATVRDVFLAGETFDVTVTTTDAAGKKTGEKMTLAVVQRTEVQGQVGERTVEEHPIATDKDKGTGRAMIKIAAGGTYILRASGTDRFGNPVSAERTVTISGDDDTVRLRILSDRHHYKAGDTASVQVHWRDEPALALVTYQGARVLGYRLVEFKKGTNKLEIPITENLAPNFDLTVSVMTNGGSSQRRVGIAHQNEGKNEGKEQMEGMVGGAHPTFHEASSPFEVERPLVLTMKPNRDRVNPGDEVEVAITATDPQGKPVRAELSLAMIEKSLLEMFPDQLAAIGNFFEGARRTSALRTVASCTFRYAPATRDISQTLIAEAARVATAEMERASRAAAGEAGDRRTEIRDNLSLIVDAENAPTDEQGEKRLGEARRFGFLAPSSATAGGGGAAGFDISGRAARRPAAPADARNLGRGTLSSGRGLPQNLGELSKQDALRRSVIATKEKDKQAGSTWAAEPDALSRLQFLNEDFDASILNKIPYGARALDEARKNAGDDGRYRYFAGQELATFKSYAGTMLSRSEGKAGGKGTQLGVMFGNGSVNYVDAGLVVNGRFDDIAARGGVAVLPETMLRETGFWNPSVVTDDDGRATVTITVPDRSTAWQLAARGITTGSLTGQATAELVAKKDLFGELKLPLAFVDGDSAQILATVHNDSVERGKIEVTLKTTIAGKPREEKRTIDVEKKGTHELTFDRDIAGAGEAVFDLAVKAIGAPVPLEDATRAVVPIRPYGIPVFSTTGGSASSNMTAWISPPAGMPVRDASLQIVIGPSVERSLLDVVLSPTGGSRYLECHKILVGESALERTTSDLLASLGLLKLIAGSRDKGSPEASALADRVRSSIGYLVSTQNDDGGWHWSAARGTKQGSSDRNASARALWSLSLARKSGFAVPDDAFNKSITFIQTAFTAARENDYDGKAMLLHSLSAAGRGDFAYANRLHRSRPSLSPMALAYLALAFVEMDRKEIAKELLDLLAPKLAREDALDRQRPGRLDVQPMLASVISHIEELKEPTRAQDAVVHWTSNETDSGLPTESIRKPAQLQKQRRTSIRNLRSEDGPDERVRNVTEVNAELIRDSQWEQSEVGAHVDQRVKEHPIAIRRFDANSHNGPFTSVTNQRREPHQSQASDNNGVTRKDVVKVHSLPGLSGGAHLLTHLIQVDVVCDNNTGFGIPSDPLAFVPVFDFGRDFKVHGFSPDRVDVFKGNISSTDADVNAVVQSGTAGGQYELSTAAQAALLTTALMPSLGLQEKAATIRPPAGSAEVRALYLLALNAVMPGDAKAKATADWLMARRAGSRWQPERATGPATLGMADYFASARFAAEHYKLKVFVNDNEVADLDIDGAAGSRVVDVPKEVLARGEKLPEKEFPGDQRKQRINFELTGRGLFTFNCTYAGFVAADQLKSTVNAYYIERHYEPAPLELDGKEIPRGFDVLTGPFTTWRNPVTELPVGRRAQVILYYYPINGHLMQEDEREYVVITEPIPSGCTVLEKSITGQFDRYEISPGAITFYVGNRSQPNEIRFDIYGYTAGKFRTAPTIVRNFYDPERMMVTQPRPLTVLAAGQKSKDEYKTTPRELYELGKRMLAKKEYARAGGYLSELFNNSTVTLKPEIYKEVAQMLFEVALKVGKSPDIVRYFEVIKEKWPDLEISFEQIVKVGAAYRELNEYERSYLVFRATAEGSFARESEIGGFLESQGEFERSVAVMDRILREYPAEPYIASAAYALAQRVYAMAPNAAGDAKLRERKITKVDLIRDAIGRLDDFLTVWPDDPAADQASFSLASALVELESWPAAIARSNRYAERFPKSEYLDSFWYIIGYSHFARGEHRAALDMCRRVAEATRTDPATGREIESKNKWRAVYISGQVHHSLGEPAEAITEYTRVVDRFPDAKETIAYFTRKAIELPEVTTARPDTNPKRERGGDAAAADKNDDKAAAGNQPSAFVELKYRNVASCEVKVYRIDLLKFGLLQRDLANITKINLAGIKPLYEAKIELGDGKDYRDRTKKLDLPLKDEGAYLVVVRGEDLHSSGLVLVTPLILEVQEEQPSGRVRATVKNTVTDKYASKVHVKVIGSRNDQFKDGSTDLRGVFVADGIQGRSTVIARAGDGQYAFYRGTLELGPPPAPAAKPQAGQTAAPAAPAPAQQELLQELFESNRMIQQQKGKELKDLYEKKSKGVQAQDAF